MHNYMDRATSATDTTLDDRKTGAPTRRHGHAGSTQPRQIAQHARTNAANAAAAARARCIAARRGGHLATTHAPNATAADQRQQHSTRQAQASRKHAAKPDSASRKQHRPGQQGLHCRAASQAPSSTNGTHDHRRAIRAACSAPGSLSRATGHRIGSGSLHCQAAPQVAFPCATAAVPSSPSARRSATHARGPRQDPHGARRHRTTAAAAANVAYLEGRRPIVRTQQHHHEM